MYGELPFLLDEFTVKYTVKQSESMFGTLNIFVPSK